MLGQEFVHFSGLVHWNFSRSVILAQFHQRTIYSDACQPSRKSRPSVEALQVKESIKEAVLNCIFSVLVISCDAMSNAEHFFDMTLVKVIKGGSLSLLGDCHEPLVTHQMEIVK